MSTIRKVFSILLCATVLFSAVNTHAQDSAATPDVSNLIEKKPSDLYEQYRHLPKSASEFEPGDKWKYFGIMYGLQWGVYLVTQWETIEEHASFDNWIHNPWTPDYDKDTYDYNIFKHAYSGQLYYQFYRSRGYDEVTAFYWTVASSMAFEFTIETMTEVPSFQDMYLTPVLGAVVGVGFEKLSLYYHSKKTLPYRLLGYVFNPFTLLPSSQYGYVAPIVSENYKGVNVSWSFE
ncbi:DUF3943 domain-containing protein [Bdellovibrio sp. HCB274]|uniref:DUF3943 domain-containing protein n=1 Tax=Bdellovibrio sp. HCB274 TaxID=3394361 RepID=UPI0039B4E087